MLTALDIGTNKIAAIVCDLKEDGGFEVISMGSCPSQGMKRGIVVNIDEMAGSIKQAIEEAELMGNCKISSVYIGVAGQHIKSVNCHGVAPIRDGEVTAGDIERAVETAQAIQIANDQRVLHVLPRDFTVDEERGIKDPNGMSGYRLEAAVHLVTGGVHPIQNITKCVKRCGLEIDGIVMESIASSLSVLTPDERELGICLVDIGGGTTDVAVFVKGAIVHTVVIPVAGDHVTNDIAISLRTPTQYAEEIKLKYGCAMRKLAAPDEQIEAPDPSKQRQATKLKRHNLAEIIEPRYEEIFSLVQRELAKHHFDEVVVSGVVLTGGSSKLEGCAELAESIFNMPVRVGHPAVTGSFANLFHDPVYATGIGLLYYATELNTAGVAKRQYRGGVKHTWSSFRTWLKEHF